MYYLKMLRKETADKQCQILNKLLISGIATSVDCPQVSVERQEFGNLSHGRGEHDDQLLIIFPL